ncbi:MAG: HAMP domain-containing histidine kinase [Caldilineaceae bacterium SB0665_bin_25]|nr:HAMP domain-containing histidine kinase [Caldilineaceae bacterium SB0665_bin_25]
MSLFWRFLGAFVLLILFSVSLSVGIGYYATLDRLDAFGGELSSKAANLVAQKLGQSYTYSNGWETLVVTVSEAGGGRLAAAGEEVRPIEDDVQGALQGEHYVLFHKRTGEDQIRVFLDVGDGYELYDDLSDLFQDRAAPKLNALRTGEQAIDVSGDSARRMVGYAILDFYKEFGATESRNFVQGLLVTTVTGGLLTVTIALLLAAWLSKRISTPVTALTEAFRTVAQRGDPALLPVTSSDELGQMSSAFNRMTTALQTQRDLRNRLLNDVSHELSTPLSIIRLEAHALGKGLQPPSQAADRIVQEVNMLGNLVRDLGWLAETESDELQLSVEPCAVDRLLSAELARWQQQAEIDRITLSLQLPPDLPDFNLDPMRMSQALGNVLDNALRHTQAGGQVEVAATIEEGRQLTISVTDDGAGIGPADLPHVVDRFYRADQSRSRRTGGAGLGLAITRAVVAAHGGTVSVSSDGLGRGTTVRIDLPLQA